MTEPAPGAVRGRPPTIALDGPAAAGKTTVGRRLAAALGYLFFDTGVLYRALTLAALRAGLGPEDGPALAALAAGQALAIEPDAGPGPGYRVLLASADVTAALRGAEVDRAVSAFSAPAAVRAALLDQQRRIARQGDSVVVGRDIGTVVLPDAALKLYLDASAAARAARRQAELAQRGELRDLGAVEAELVARDAGDASRPVAPLAVAPDAVRVATDRCDLEGVVAHLVSLVARWPDPLTTGGGAAPCGESDA